MTPKNLREWLFQNNQNDQWWLSIDGVTIERNLTINEIEERLKLGLHGTALAMHHSHSKLSNPPWIEVELPYLTPSPPPFPSSSPPPYPNSSPPPFPGSSPPPYPNSSPPQTPSYETNRPVEPHKVLSAPHLNTKEPLANLKLGRIWSYREIKINVLALGIVSLIAIFITSNRSIGETVSIVLLSILTIQILALSLAAISASIMLLFKKPFLQFFRGLYCNFLIFFSCLLILTFTFGEKFVEIIPALLLALLFGFPAYKLERLSKKYKRINRRNYWGLQLAAAALYLVTAIFVFVLIGSL